MGNVKRETLEINIWYINPLELAGMLKEYMEKESTRPDFDPKKYTIRHGDLTDKIVIERVYEVKF